MGNFLKKRIFATTLSMLFSIVLLNSQPLNIDELIECSRINDVQLLSSLLSEKGFQELHMEDGTMAFVSKQDLNAGNKVSRSTHVIPIQDPGQHLINILSCDYDYYQSILAELSGAILGFEIIDRHSHAFREAAVTIYESARIPDIRVTVTEARVHEYLGNDQSDQFDRYELEIINLSSVH